MLVGAMLIAAACGEAVTVSSPGSAGDGAVVVEQPLAESGTSDLTATEPSAAARTDSPTSPEICATQSPEVQDDRTIDPILVSNEMARIQVWVEADEVPTVVGPFDQLEGGGFAVLSESIGGMRAFPAAEAVSRVLEARVPAELSDAEVAAIGSREAPLFGQESMAQDLERLVLEPGESIMFGTIWNGSFQAWAVWIAFLVGPDNTVSSIRDCSTWVAEGFETMYDEAKAQGSTLTAREFLISVPGDVAYALEVGPPPPPEPDLGSPDVFNDGDFEIMVTVRPEADFPDEVVCLEQAGDLLCMRLAAGGGGEYTVPLFFSEQGEIVLTTKALSTDPVISSREIDPTTTDGSLVIRVGPDLELTLEPGRG